MSFFHFRLFSFSFLCLFLSLRLIYPSVSIADEEVKLFNEDLKRTKTSREKKQEQILKSNSPKDSNLKFDAPNLVYDKDSQKIKGDGGVVLSFQGITAQADEGAVQAETKDAELQGNVLMSWSAGTIGCDSAEMNIENETGVFKNGHAILENGQYKVQAKEIRKVSEFDYRFDEASFTTCHCTDSSCPWSINANEIEATQEGYGIAKGASFDIFGVPILYTPYLIFPVKNERQSGLLAPQFGYGNQDGFMYKQPVFVVLDDQKDILLEPFIETRTRRGSSVHYRQSFSTKSNLETKFIYSDESPRNGDLRGVNTEGMFDPTFDENRYGIYGKQYWRNEPNSSVSLSLASDIHYISDDLFLREIEDSDIGRYNDRYATSTVTGTANFGDATSVYLMGEYNQALIYEDDDYLFQRLPEVGLTTKKNFRPFGYNKYGVKVKAGVDLDYTEFSRKKGYDGGRVDIHPSITIPHHYKNYFSGQLGVGLNYTSYQMNDRTIPGNTEGAKMKDGDRAVANFTYKLSTGIEKVYDLDPDSSLAWLTSLGYSNRDRKLRRVKHTIEPILAYMYVPYTEQDDLPFYDSLDRIRHKSVFLYGIKTSLYARYLPPNIAGEDIPELSPELKDLPTIDSEQPIPELDMPKMFDPGIKNVKVREGENREIMSFYIRQTYDYVKDHNKDTTDEPFSDISLTYTFDPTPNLGFSTSGDYDFRNGDFSSWNASANFSDDRKDSLRLEYSYIEKQISQITPGVEIVLTDRYKAGYYARFDGDEGEFLEMLGALRYTNPCNCWYLDIGYRDRINPDKKDIMFTLTFRGLGGSMQKIDVNGKSKHS